MYIQYISSRPHAGTPLYTLKSVDNSQAPRVFTRARPLAARVIKWAAFFSFIFFGVASVTFHQRIAGSIIQDGRRLKSGRQAFCIIYIIISLRKCMVCLWFILLRNRTIPKHYLSPHCVNAW